MTYETINKGALWNNQDKKSDSHPDMKGSINIEGVEYWLSVWRNDPKGNPKAPALKLSVQRKDEVHKQGYQEAQQQFQTPPAGQEVSSPQQAMEEYNNQSYPQSDEPPPF